jgi:hypothetical protein
MPTLIVGSAMAKNAKERRRLTILLLAITISFILMTLPPNILFGFFKIQLGSPLLPIYAFFDYIGFLNRASLFFNCFITNLKFRTVVMKFLVRQKVNPVDFTNLEKRR